MELVGREDIGNAVALNSALFNGARVVGPAIAGIVIGLSGVSLAFLIDGVSFLAVLAGLLLMREEELRRTTPPGPRPGSVGAVLGTIADGLRYVRRTDLVLLATLVVGLVSTFGLNFTVLAPALAQDVLHTDASGYGFLMAATGVGSLLTALVIAFRGSARPATIAAGALLLGLAEVVLGVSGLLSVSLLAMAAVGVGTILMAATANTVIQLAVPDELRGRVMSVYTTVFAGSTPIGGLLMGWVAAQAGIGEAFVVGGLGASPWPAARSVPAPPPGHVARYAGHTGGDRADRGSAGALSPLPRGRDADQRTQMLSCSR